MHVARVARDGVDPVEVRDPLVVDRDLPAANLGVPLDLVELHERDRGEHVAQVRLVAGHRDVVERAVAAAHHAQVVERLGEVVAVRRDQAALAGGDVLRRVEREAGQVGDRADLAAAVARLGGVRRVLDDRQPEREQRVEIRGLAVEVDRQDRLGPLVDELADALRVDVERVLATRRRRPASRRSGRSRSRSPAT